MPLIAKDTGGGDYTPVEEGTHLAVCNMVVDLGLQEVTYKGETKTAHQCYIRWELPNERIEWTDDNGPQEGPMVIGRTYTVSLGPKANLRKDLQAWRTKAFTEEELKGFNLFNLLGHGCQVTVTHKPKEGGGVYVNVAGIAGWPKGMDKKGAERPLVKYSADEPDQFDELPKWIQEKLSKAVDPDEADERGPGSAGDYGARTMQDMDDEIPF